MGDLIGGIGLVCLGAGLGMGSEDPVNIWTTCLKEDVSA